ncbi:undecaprenyl-diphosphate phosphatase [Entomobacter blattae]|uniref:Undecaprenyl-diphosphatase n=1 Tax=Entomobacter blattae TaxID=2762277 RepID=A0A7H1NSZ8_9PROT|nr:undecaprenyl-diphosphate phosphatase [Entomobacter blattae]QNT78908.1 Undecaprenyl-diphosphatase [Entomobacter blattae]
MGFFQGVIIAILQGMTELFPVSSLGHAVVVPALFGWHVDRHDEAFLPFLVMLHLGTAVALLLFFWKDWEALTKGALGHYGQFHQRESWHILSLLVIATIPAVIIGAIFESLLRSLFGTPDIVALLLICNGLVLLIAEKIKSRYDFEKRTPLPSIAQLTHRDALFIGCFQCAAFLPGISRSGVTIVAGLLRKLDHEMAARFSFLLALPIILAASAHEGFKAVRVQIAFSQWALAGFCSILAAITALLSTAFLMKYFKNNDKWALTPFALYCIGLGFFSFLVLAIF